MSHRDFSISEAVWPTRRLLNVKQGGVPRRVRVKQAHRQRAISAKREEVPVHNAVQGGRLQAISVGREARHQGATNVGVAVVQERSVRLGLMWVKQCQLSKVSK